MARDKPIILDDDDPPPRRLRERTPESRAGFELGLASVMIGATFLIVGGMAHAYLNLLIELRSGRRDLPFHAFLSYLGILTFFGAEIICIVGVIMGMRGIGRAREEDGSAALPVAGILLGLFAAFIWIFAAIILMTRSV